ncbi:MAG: glycoside hydrolase family 9 protein [Ignavibacteriaceae bacterium]
MKRLFKLFRTFLLKHPVPFLVIGLSFLFIDNADCQDTKLQLNDLDYFETQGLNVFVFSNQYNGFFYDEKTAGIELIHHGVRTATNGAVRLRSTPEQWDLIPEVVSRKVDEANNSIEVLLRYKDYNFDSKVVVTAKDQGVLIDVFLDKPLPEKLDGHAGFNLEFLPSAYFEKTYLIDNSPGIFPLYPGGPTVVKPIKDKISQFNGHSTFDDRGRGEFVDPLPIATGSTLILAPEDPERRVEINSFNGKLMLYDGRNVAQNGWFVVRSLIPSDKTGKVVEWYLTANTIKDWKRSPVIGFSQVGYNPDQQKVAVIELDKNDTPLTTASLFQVMPDGNFVEKLTEDVKMWGQYLRYNYVTFDFSSVKDSGLYLIKYGDQKTETFPIDTHVYDNIWQKTLDIYFPVQMDHMFVNEAYRVWHGHPYKDDALQAPVNEQHFDGYSMDSTTDTKYKPLERIPGLAVGGWFDAGDFDIQDGSHNTVVYNFSNLWETFQVKHDQTFVDRKTSFVDIHRPDGIPDVLQQIEQGALQLVAQQKNIGHAVRGIIVPHLYQYHHLGDAINETDNLPYNPKLKPYETDGKSSGTLDDRWVFTNRVPYLNYGSITALATAYRALKNYNKDLSEEALKYAIEAWDNEHKVSGWGNAGEDRWFRSNVELEAALQLYISTKDEQYSKRFKDLVWTVLDRSLPFNILAAVQAIPYMDEEYKSTLKSYIEKYKDQLDQLSKENPYGVPIIIRGWGGNTMVVNWAITNYYLNKAFPEIIGPEYTFKGLNYIFGCHPYSNISFVSGVGVHSKKVAYGNNRANFTFIPGGVVPGLLILKPDFPENKEDWPFFWGENEYVIDICSAYIFLSNAANDLLSKGR